MEKYGNIYIEEPEIEFKRVYKGIINDPNIDCLTLGIYVKILTLGKKWQLNIKGLSSFFGISDTKIRKSISLLECEGYISRKAVQDEKTGRLLGLNYTLHAIPLDESKRTCAGRSKTREIDYQDRPCTHETVYPENRVPGKPCTRETVYPEKGGHNIYKLNKLINLNENDRLNERGNDEKDFSPAPPRTEQRKFSKENGLTPGNLNVRQSAIDKIDAAFEQLIFPYEDAEFKKLFYILCCSPKWRAKTIHALQMSLNKLQNYDRDFSAKLIEDSIAGGWQGLVFGDTDKKYQDYLKTKKGSISIGSGVTYNPMSEQERQEYMDFLKMMDE